MPNALTRLLLLMMVVLPASLFATHNRAGHIEISPVDPLCGNPLTVRAVITTYTKTSSVPADRDTLTICWGDGFCERVARNNGAGNPPQGVPLENDVKFNTYVASHTYGFFGVYRVSMTDPNRNGGILNVNPPNSDAIRFHIETVYSIPNPQFNGCNSSPRLTVPPVDIGCVGRVFTHNPGAFDPDGDSLSYGFIVPLQDEGLQVPNYLFPNQINPIPGQDSLIIDPRTGDIRWNAPTRAGEYNLAIAIVSFRNGFPLDTVIRDMQILIEECNNLPPNLVLEQEEVCVVAGELFSMRIRADAPEMEVTQRTRVEAFGLPFEVEVSPAELIPDTKEFEPGVVIRTFQWQTTCDHISDQFYTVVFKATDNFFGDTTGLATLKSFRIKVVGPPPEDVQAQPRPDAIEVTWESPYDCETPVDRFRGFTVWRRENSNNFPLDTCEPGLAGRGYEKLTNVAFIQEEDGRYFFSDPNVERGRTYCYRVLGEFAQTAAGSNFPFNLVESLPSEEICVQLARDLPLTIKVDVQATDPNGGQIEVCWTKPLPDDLDTLLNTGPYTYEVLRADGITNNPDDYNPIPGARFTSPTFAGANDTCYLDGGLNTTETPYSYRINFFTSPQQELLGATNAASSVFLTVNPTDMANTLSWDFLVPWENEEFVVLRQNAAGDFDSIALVTSPEQEFLDENLTNGVEYCYQIKSLGSYNIDNVPSPLINFSQEACGTPLDNVPPCAPDLSATNACDDGVSCDNAGINFLSWTNPNEVCADTDDAAGYILYFSPTLEGTFQPIQTFSSATDTTYQDEPPTGLAGCYYITALDSMGNESEPSPIACVSSCSFYELPNAFTPNSDGNNDLFVPITNCQVVEVEFQVFNRWGEVVFETSDPQLNWDGTNLQGEDLAEGVYFYTCKIFEQSIDGTQLAPYSPLSGYIQLVRGLNK